MSEILNINVIKFRYPNRWVILDELVLSEPGPIIRGGHVIFDCQDEETARLKLQSLPKGVDYSIQFTGDPMFGGYYEAPFRLWQYLTGEK